MRPDGSGETLISQRLAGRRPDLGAQWPCSDVQPRGLEGSRGSQIWSVDVTGRNERRVLTPGSASDPAWSPLIQ